MANNLMFNIEPDFDLEGSIGEIAAIYQSRGYSVRTLKMKNGFKLTIEKGVGGINMILGMGQAITATFTTIGKEKDTLTVAMSDGDWTGKIVGLVVGWFLCFVPVITAVIGFMRQSGLQKSLENDIQMALSDGI